MSMSGPFGSKLSTWCSLPSLRHLARRREVVCGVKYLLHIQDSPYVKTKLVVFVEDQAMSGDLDIVTLLSDSFQRR